MHASAAPPKNLPSIKHWGKVLHSGGKRERERERERERGRGREGRDKSERVCV
jgi:hypothetical protein